ncbi:MAG: LexA family transcriptional regulator [Saprospiraceae bacterium]|nr:LexA family transcriptional regulator [Saprospiraceae bacterium]
MNHVVSQRFIECYHELLETNLVKSARQFALSLEVLPQTMHEILKGRRDVNVELIQKAVEIFQVNPSFLFQGIRPLFLGYDSSQNFKILTIFSDRKGKESIVHVPVAAQAGYPGLGSDPLFIDELPKYSLPDLKFTSDGTLRSFEVSGESMSPTIEHGDLIICRYLHPFYWENQLKNGPIYVIITQQDVLVKRVSNLLRSEKKLLLYSDNVGFGSYSIPGPEIKEIWHVCAKISTKLDLPTISENSSNEQLKSIISKQTHLLEQILQKV